MPTKQKMQTRKTSSKKSNTKEKLTKKKVTKKKKFVKKLSPGKKSTAIVQELPPKKEFSKELYKLYEQGLRFLHRNSYEKARDKFIQLLEKFPTDIEVTSRAKTFVQICDRHLNLKQNQPALNPEVIFNQAAVHHNANRYEEALETLSQAIKLTPKRRDHIYYSMAAAEVCIGNTTQGLKYLRKAITMNEKNRFFANNDPDFEPIADSPEFEELIHPE